MVAAHWEHFEHEADIGVRGIGADLPACFAQAALAMTAIITNPASVETETPVDIRCEETDPELLLVDWLNALIYEMAVRNMVFGRFEVAIQQGVLSARAWGETVNREKHQPAVEIKGATYTELAVRQQDGCWLAQCVVDV